ncbi:MAG: flagellar motor protein MotB [Deltaproteobacteria bacterium]|nr:flagellar motor protein MotB [Deltaproteobacteria bacterium]MBI3295179.1 flagellar motor protein MotB [Deltaproteobacteria bacterium]
MKKHQEEHENMERWLVSYADFITLLFAFFTVLYALGSTESRKYKEAAESIQKAFMSGGYIFPQKSAPFTPLKGEKSQLQEIPPSSENGTMSKADQEALQKLVAQIRDAFNRSTGVKMMEGELGVIKTEDGFKIRLGENVFFKSGSAKLQKDYVPLLIEITKRIMQLNYRVQVDGHSDAAPGVAEKDNWQLSIDRSYNLMKFMTEGIGFPKNNISVAGYGDSQPIAENETPEGRARNRRVEISVITPRSARDNAW